MYIVDLRQVCVFLSPSLSLCLSPVLSLSLSLSLSVSRTSKELCVYVRVWGGCAGGGGGAGSCVEVEWIR